MVKTLVSLEETTKKTNMNGGESSEESRSSCCSKRHGLSRVRRIEAVDVNRSEVEQLIEIMPFITAPHWIWVVGEYGEVYDAESTESLLRSIPITYKLEILTLSNINVTSSPAVEFISRVFKQDLPNLEWLDMSYNPLLGAGVSSVIKHLSFAPHLETLYLAGVKMTPQQVMDLTAAVQQHGNIADLRSSYHDDGGNPEPEHEWPSENYWKMWYPDLFHAGSKIVRKAHQEKMSENRRGAGKRRILAETRPSIHDVRLADDQETLETFPLPPDPADVRRKRERLKRRRGKVPSEIKARGPRAKLAYENALKTGKVKVYRARIMLIGQDRAGKTSFKKSFLGLPFDPEEDSTDGIEVDPAKFEVDIDQVKNWKRTDEKLSVSQFASDLATMVAREIQEDKDESDNDYEYEREKQKEDESKLGLVQKRKKQTKMDQFGFDAPREMGNSQMNQGTSGKDPKVTKTGAPIELNIDPTLPPEEFEDHLEQLLNGLNLQTDATIVEHHMTLDLWDFAGQQLYYASYPVFLSSRAVYILVYDLSKGLYEPAQPCFIQGDRKIPLGNPNEETNVENLLSWLVSVGSICSSEPEIDETEKAVQDHPHCRPPVFIVGTHADKRPREDIVKVQLQIKRELLGNSQNVIRPIFSVDNTQGSSDEGVAALQKRLIEVLKQEPYMGEEVPVRWFNFEKVVKALVAKKVYYLNMEQLQTIIQKYCFIEDKHEVATLLNFYHDLGVIVKHGDTVVLQAQWLIKLFKKLITVRPFDDMNPRHCEMWEEMKKTGVLNMELVDHVLSEFCQQGVVKDDILKMMGKFGLIVQFTLSPTEEKYFVPCQLRSPPDILCQKEPSSGDPCPLYLHFPRGYVPHGLYLQLVSRCARWCSENGFKTPPKLYDGASRFFIGKELTHQIILVCKKRFIKIILKKMERKCAPLCGLTEEKVPIVVRTFLNKTMQNLSETLPWLLNVAYDLRVECPYCLKEEAPCDKHKQFPCSDDRCMCLLYVAQNGSYAYCTNSCCDEILPLPALEKWFSSSSEDSSIKEEVQTRTRPERKLPLSTSQHSQRTKHCGNIKNGVVDDEELEGLSHQLGDAWEALARRLGFNEAEIQGLNYNYPSYPKKQFNMLYEWKQRLGSGATYKVLFDALCHKYVKRERLAETWCIWNNDAAETSACFNSSSRVTRPDGKPETLGLVVLDEPIAKQSDPTVLDMTIRTISKQTNVKSMTVRSIEDPEKNPKAVDNWIDSIRELHQQKPAPAVHYQRNMPDIEFLMQEWPEEFEELLNKVGLPTADLDVDLKQYVDLVCGILGIPVHNNRIHALHVLFTLFSEFKNSQHFKQLAKDNQLSSDLRLDSTSSNSYTGGVAAATEHMTLSGEEAQTMSFDD